MYIEHPLHLKKIVQHYETKLKEVNLEGEEDLRIYTEIGKDFITKSLGIISELLEALGNMDHRVELYEVSYPKQKTLVCLALDQYIKDLRHDEKVLEDSLSFKSEYLEKIQSEIQSAEVIKNECGCGSRGKF